MRFENYDIMANEIMGDFDYNNEYKNVFLKQPKYLKMMDDADEFTNHFRYWVNFIKRDERISLNEKIYKERMEKAKEGIEPLKPYTRNKFKYDDKYNPLNFIRDEPDYRDLKEFFLMLGIADKKTPEDYTYRDFYNLFNMWFLQKLKKEYGDDKAYRYWDHHLTFFHELKQNCYQVAFYLFQFLPNGELIKELFEDVYDYLDVEGPDRRENSKKKKREQEYSDRKIRDEQQKKDNFNRGL